MERRFSERKTLNIDTTLIAGNLFYSGTVLNISEKGMSICSKIRFPDDSVLVVIIRKKIMVIARVKWAKQKNSHYYTIGVELLNPLQDYLELVNSLRSA
ncbi:MAG TPA: PilZ domain-containing protein [Nitrospirae bacterium]|nr:PilZ domain protein [bacterium BMS3Abin06]HDH12242.1 PilZ domain-containing protein [Nitrospirota bacterium]HDZ01118.1 PilZ domain-containing protein [Nitrospirota bacterium]